MKNKRTTIKTYNGPVLSCPNKSSILGSITSDKIAGAQNGRKNSKIKYEWQRV